MSAHLITITNPFRPQIGAKAETCPSRVRLSTILRQRGYISGRGDKIVRHNAFVVMVNGTPVLRAGWGRVTRDNDLVTISHLPKGGKGSNPLQMVAMIALVVAAAYIGQSATVIGALGKTGAAIAAAGIMVGGSMLLQMIFPPPAASFGAASSSSNPSPSYTFGQDDSNSARLLQPIPVLYGRFRVVPDYISQPYVENRGNLQYIHMLFCVSQGDVDIEQIRIADADISNYSEIETQIVKPGQRVTLFPDNVTTAPQVDNLELFAPNQPGYAVLGPFPVNPPGTKITSIGFDTAMPGGSYALDDRGRRIPATVNYRFEYRQIDDNGNPTGGGWLLLYDGDDRFATDEPQLATHRVNMPGPGRYEVKAFRTNDQITDGRTRSQILWTALRGYHEPVASYGNLTLVAMVVRASNNVNGNLARKVSVIGTRKLPKWDPVNGWGAPQVTRNPAWAIADAIRNPEYGRGLPTTAMNIEEIYRLAQVWDARGDEFNGVFDTQSTFWNALSELCAVGRAMPMYYAGVIDVIRNEPKSIPAAMYGPGDMARGSFNTRYLFPSTDAPDHVVMEYTDDVTWKPTTVECALPGSPKLNPFTLSMRGLTKREQTWREGVSRAAANRDQRRAVSFTTNEQALLVRYNDLVEITHDVPGWGYYGRVESLNKVSGVIQTSEPLVFVQGVDHFISFKKKNGGVAGPYRIVATASRSPKEGRILETQAVINSIYIASGTRQDKTQYAFGPSQRQSLKALVQSIRPGKDGSIGMTFVNYADSVHMAEGGGDVPPPGPISNLPNTPVLPIINSVTLELTNEVGVQMIVATPARGATYYEFQTSVDGGASWADVGSDALPRFRVQLPTGNAMVRARGVGRLAGPWATWSGYVNSTSQPMVEIGSLTATQDKVFVIDLGFSVKQPSGGFEESIEIWESAQNSIGNAALLIRIPANVTRYTRSIEIPDVNRWYFARVIDKAGRPGPWYNNGVGVLGKTSMSAAAIMAYFDKQINLSHLGQSLVTWIESIEPDMTAVYAKIEEEREAWTAADSALASQTSQVAARVDNAFVVIQNNNQARITAEGALGSRIDTTQASIGNVQASVQTNAQAIVNTQNNVNGLAGTVAAAYTIKVQVVAGGRTVMAGIGLGVDNNSGILESSVLVLADKFAVGTATGGSGSFVSAFIIKGGIVYMNTAVIENASITNAHILNLDAAKVTFGQMHGDRVEANTMAANLLNVGTAYIKRANIQELAVDTFRIGDNAATVAAAFVVNRSFGQSSGDNLLQFPVYLPVAATVYVIMDLVMTGGSPEGQNVYFGANIGITGMGALPAVGTDGFTKTRMLIAAGKPQGSVALHISCDRPGGGTRYVSGNVIIVAIMK